VKYCFITSHSASNFLLRTYW